MTAETFVRWAEDYYGKYRPVVRAELITWLSEKDSEGRALRPPHLIAGLRERVRDEYSNQYRSPPDIALLKPLSHQQETYDLGRKIMALAATARPQLVNKDDEETAHLFAIAALRNARRDGRLPHLPHPGAGGSTPALPGESPISPAPEKTDDDAWEATKGGTA